MGCRTSKKGEVLQVQLLLGHIQHHPNGNKYASNSVMWFFDVHVFISNSNSSAKKICTHVTYSMCIRSCAKVNSWDGCYVCVANVNQWSSEMFTYVYVYWIPSSALEKYAWIIGSQKRSPKPKNRTNSAKEFSEQFAGVSGPYPLKQGFWGKSHQKVHPKVRRNLCRKSSSGYLFCPWELFQVGMVERNAGVSQRHLAWWAFRPRKKIFSSTPENSVQTPSQPLPPPLMGEPPPWDSQ